MQKRRAAASATALECSKRCAADATPSRTAWIPPITRSLNLDPLRLSLGLLAHGHVQHAVCQLGGDRVRVDRLRQRHRASDLTVSPLIDQARPLLIRGASLGGDAQRALLVGEIDVLAGHARYV